MVRFMVRVRVRVRVSKRVRAKGENDVEGVTEGGLRVNLIGLG